MVLSREGQRRGSPAMQILPPSAAGYGFGALGVNWNLVLQVGGWVIQGIGLGLSVYESVKQGAEKTGLKQGDLTGSDIAELAKMISLQDPSGRSAAQWQQDLSSMIGGTGTTVPVACPPGSYRDPATQLCLPVKKAGFLSNLSTVEMIALGVGGFLLAKAAKLI